MSARAEVVVITGASAGVGRAAARKFARHGARIGLLARGNDGLEAARREVEELGSEALVVTTDVADADQVESAAAKIDFPAGGRSGSNLFCGAPKIQTVPTTYGSRYPTITARTARSTRVPIAGVRNCGQANTARCLRWRS
jgi:NAD(P)-dependent dehydrogenase (short-subunit alcohol dehydrogenase family)